METTKSSELKHPFLINYKSINFSKLKKFLFKKNSFFILHNFEGKLDKKKIFKLIYNFKNTSDIYFKIKINSSLESNIFFWRTFSSFKLVVFYLLFEFSKKINEKFKVFTFSPVKFLKVEENYKLLNSYITVDKMNNIADYSFPKSFHLALSTGCNLKCDMCPYHSKEFRQIQTNNYFKTTKSIKGNLLIKIFKEIGKYNSHVRLGQYDEPFMYKNLTNYILKGMSYGCRISITTNGTLININEIQKLLDKNLSEISFSLDAASTSTYKKIRHDDFKIPILNLKKIVDIRNKLNSKTVIRACMVVQKDNEHEINKFKVKMKEIGVDVVSFYNLTIYKDKKWINSKLNFEVQDQSITQKREPCSQLWNQMSIYPDGKVSLCCATTLYTGFREDLPYVGDLNKNSIKSIWNCSKYKTIRKDAFNNKYNNSVCRDCEIWYNHKNIQASDKQGNLIHKNPYETFVFFK